MQYGRDNEAVAKSSFQDITGEEVLPCGLYISDTESYLAATPDGLIGENSIIEIKCPYSARHLTPEEAVETKKIKFAVYKDGKFTLKRNDVYYYQVQGQLNVLKNKDYCYFVCWTPKGLAYEKIEKDTEFFNKNMLPKLQKFYFEHYLPELTKLEVIDRSKIS